MDLRTRRTVAILLLVSLAAAIVLSSSLANLRLGPGDPFPGASSQSSQTETGVVARRLPAGETLPVFRGILAVSLLVLGALLVTRLASITSLKHLFGLLVAMAAITLLLISLPRLSAGGAIELPREAAAPRVPSTDYETSPLGTPPPSFVWTAGLLVLAGAAFALIVSVRPRPGPVKVSDGLVAEANRALEEIEAGANATSVIVRCYLQMTSLIQKARGLSRDRGMTVREFEKDLKDLGLPHEPLLRLRSLFEAVRYGDRQMSAGEEQAAVDCLSEMVSFLRGGAA